MLGLLLFLLGALTKTNLGTERGFRGIESGGIFSEEILGFLELTFDSD